MYPKFDRRRLLATFGLAGLALGSPVSGLARTTHAYGFPIAEPGGLPGDGFFIRHGFQTENTWFDPGDWHTAEDWYRLDGVDTAGAHVVAIGDGDVVFVDFDYPGRVIIVQHRPDLFSMYGHLDYDTIAVTPGDRVVRGQQLGTVLQRGAGESAPSHLHFEIRNFLYAPEVNGDTPRYAYICAYHCAPGPGYWPMGAPELPSGMGWRNPTHVIGNRLLLDGPIEVQVPVRSSGSISLTSAPWESADSTETARLELITGTRYSVRAIDSGPEVSTQTSAEAYQLSFLIDDGKHVSGWVRAAIPDYVDTGSDGRPSSVRFSLLPVLE